MRGGMLAKVVDLLAHKCLDFKGYAHWPDWPDWPLSRNGRREPI